MAFLPAQRHDAPRWIGIGLNRGARVKSTSMLIVYSGKTRELRLNDVTDFFDFADALIWEPIAGVLQKQKDLVICYHCHNKAVLSSHKHHLESMSYKW